jgi:hypothetical protein
MAQVQLTTDVKNFDYETMITGTNVTGELYNFRRYPTATRPASAKGSIVIGGNQNYLKFQIFNEDSGAQLTGYMHGWNFCSEKMIWVPQVLWSGTIAFAGDAVTLPFASLARVGRYTTTSNCKELQFTGENPSSTLLVDCVGAQFVEFSVHGAVNASDVNLHILYSSI